MNYLRKTGKTKKPGNIKIDRNGQIGRTQEQVLITLNDDLLESDADILRNIWWEIATESGSINSGHYKNWKPINMNRVFWPIKSFTSLDITLKWAKYKAAASIRTLFFI
jgi:hypothetical protein